MGRRNILVSGVIAVLGFATPASADVKTGIDAYQRADCGCKVAALIGFNPGFHIGARGVCQNYRDYCARNQCFATLHHGYFRYWGRLCHANA